MDSSIVAQLSPAVSGRWCRKLLWPPPWHWLVLEGETLGVKLTLELHFQVMVCVQQSTKDQSSRATKATQEHDITTAMIVPSTSPIGPDGLRTSRSTPRGVGQIKQSRPSTRFVCSSPKSVMIRHQKSDAATPNGAHPRRVSTACYRRH